MYAFFQIAHQTFRECLRLPVLFVLNLASLLLIGIHPVIALFVFREQQKLVTDGALATIFLFGWIAAVICASHTVHREINEGTILLVLSKPVGKATFVLAKVTAVLAVLTLFVWMNGIGTFLAVRISAHQFELDGTILFMYFAGIFLACIIGAAGNFLARTSFPSTALIVLGIILTVTALAVYWLLEFENGYRWENYIGYSRNLIAAIVLLLLAILIMGSVATSFSVYFSLLSNMILCGVIFLLGLISDYLYYRVTHMNRVDTVQLIRFWPYCLLPLTALYWFFAIKKTDGRRRATVKYNLAFSTVILFLVGMGIYNTTTEANFRSPSVLTAFLASVIHSVKDTVSGILHGLLPNWQLFWMADALVAKKAIPIGYLAFGLFYMLCFVAVFTSLAIALLTNREVGDQKPR